MRLALRGGATAMSGARVEIACVRDDFASILDAAPVLLSLLGGAQQRSLLGFLRFCSVTRRRRAAVARRWTRTTPPPGTQFLDSLMHVTSSDPSHRLQHKESAEVAGVLGAAVAHELRNMLASAASSIFLAKRDLDKRECLASHLDSAEAELERCQDVIERVLRLVRGEPIHREPTRIADIVAQAQRNVRGSSVRIEQQIEPADIEISCEPLLAERLLTNLFSNAIEALGPGSSGTIFVRAYVDKLAVIMDVEDDGPGFAPEVLARLFEPGVTTKSTGTGLGLVLCRSIVRVHGGDMYVQQAPSGGALVRCVFVQENSAG